MSGDETTRFCSYCNKHVHNLEAMSVGERLGLLSSPAASICARYKIAIRRPVKGKKESYMRHMAKYGAGVALASSALLVLCEMYAENGKRTYYRAFAGRPHNGYVCHLGWDAPDMETSEIFYVEQEVVMLGLQMAIPNPTRPLPTNPDGPTTAPRHIDLTLDPVEIDRLLQPAKPAALELKPADPLKKKKAGKRGLRDWGA